MALAIHHQKEMKLTQSSCKRSSRSSLRMFHEDVMSLILARLPLKSLCMSKSVCKTWLSIISQQDFIKLYANHWKSGSRLLLSRALAIHHQKEMKLTQSSCKRSSSSSSSLGMFHEDIMSLILARLPLKSLCISKSVCKTWLSITSHPQFLKLYANQWNGGSRLLLSIRHGAHQRYLLGTTTSNVLDFEEWFSLPFTKYHGVTQVINGLVCFYKGCRVWICNLTTGEIRELPSPYSKNNKNNNNVRFAFGFDPISGAYKLIKLDRKSGHCKILILGDQDMSWKNNEVIGGCRSNRSASFIIYRYPKMEEAFCIDGSLYWLQGRIGVTSFHLNQHFFAYNTLAMLDLRMKNFGSAVLQFRGRFALPYKTSDRSRHLHLKSLIDNCWTDYTFISSMKHKSLIPFSCLPTGEIMMVDPEFSDHCIYSYDLETQNLERFVVGKFPISKMDSSARISCFQPNFNPLSLILKPNSGCASSFSFI